MPRDNWGEEVWLDQCVLCVCVCVCVWGGGGGGGGNYLRGHTR